MSADNTEVRGQKSEVSHRPPASDLCPLPSDARSAPALCRLEEAALAAVGRPETRCQIMVADLYKSAGLLPADLPIPEGDRDWARTQGRSLIVEWVQTSGRFVAIDAVEPGALLCFRLGHAPHHVAIALSGGRMVHVFGHHGIQLAPCIPPEWAKRLHRIWRITPPPSDLRPLPSALCPP